MKYVNLLLIALLLLAGCGKKTDPIPKSTLVDLTPPAAVFYSVTDEGVRIENQEKDNLLIEKGIPEGEECTFFNTVTLIGPNSVYVDKEVDADQKYFYRVKKKTVKFGLLSSPYVFSLTYEKPLKIKDAQLLKTPLGYNVTIEPSDIFMRFDVYSGGKSIAQTGGSSADVLSSEMSGNRLTLVLTDYYGNKGELYALEIPVEKKLKLPSAVETVSVLDYALNKRIAWSDTENTVSYIIDVCVGSVCEQFTSPNTSILYTKPIKKCIDVTVTAVNGDGNSKPKKVKYCRPEEE